LSHRNLHLPVTLNTNGLPMEGMSLMEYGESTET
jgi:hypothetical protein